MKLIYISLLLVLLPGCGGWGYSVERDIYCASSIYARGACPKEFEQTIWICKEKKPLFLYDIVVGQYKAQEEANAACAAARK